MQRDFVLEEDLAERQAELLGIYRKLSAGSGHEPSRRDFCSELKAAEIARKKAEASEKIEGKHPLYRKAAEIGVGIGVGLLYCASPLMALLIPLGEAAKRKESYDSAKTLYQIYGESPSKQ